MAELDNAFKARVIKYEKLIGGAFSLAVFFVFFVEGAAGFSISPIESLVGKNSWSGIELEWKTPPLQESEGVEIIKKENTCPLFVGDGESVYRGNGRAIKDKKIKAGQSFCYGAYVFDASGRVSEIVTYGPIKKESRSGYLINYLTENSNLLSGMVIVVILWGVHKKTMKKPKKMISIIRN